MKYLIENGFLPGRSPCSSGFDPAFNQHQQIVPGAGAENIVCLGCNPCCRQEGKNQKQKPVGRPADKKERGCQATEPSKSKRGRNLAELLHTSVIAAP